MVSTIITFSKADIKPPVFLAGSFSQWTPLEMKVKQSDNAGSVENLFSYETDLPPGEYQYKFRLGPGDWWVLDESSPSADDGSGNVNNILKVQPEELKATQYDKEKNMAQVPIDAKDQTSPKSLLNLQGSQETPALSGNVPGNIGKGIVKAQGPTNEDPQEKSAKVNSHVDGPKEDSLPDIAPPPYSEATETGAGLTPSLKSESATLESADGRNDARNHDVKSSAESKQSHDPWTDRLRSRNVALVIAVLVVPVAVSFLWYR